MNAWIALIGGLAATAWFAVPLPSLAESPLPADRMLLHVRGKMTDIVLVDPRGRVDRQTDTLTITDIPECDRWPEGVRETILDEEPQDPYGLELESFELGAVEYGGYVLQARADEKLDASIDALVTPEAGGGCHTVRDDPLSPGIYWWIISLRASPGGECSVLISHAIRQDSWSQGRTKPAPGDSASRK